MPMARETLSLIDGRLALTALMKRHANSMCISLPAADAELGVRSPKNNKAMMCLIIRAPECLTQTSMWARQRTA
jgi:hypothetical protein